MRVYRSFIFNSASKLIHVRLRHTPTTRPFRMPFIPASTESIPEFQLLEGVLHRLRLMENLDLLKVTLFCRFHCIFHGRPFLFLT